MSNDVRTLEDAEALLGEICDDFDGEMGYCLGGNCRHDDGGTAYHIKPGTARRAVNKEHDEDCVQLSSGRWHDKTCFFARVDAYLARPKGDDILYQQARTFFNGQVSRSKWEDEGRYIVTDGVLREAEFPELFRFITGVTE